MTDNNDQSSIETDHLHTYERGADVVYWVDEDGGHTNYASGPDEMIASGHDPADHLQAALDWMGENGWGTVYVKDRLRLSHPITIPEGVRLTGNRAAVLVNEQDDPQQPLVQVDPWSEIGRLRIDCKGKAGVRVGEPLEQTSVNIGTLNIYGAGDGATAFDVNGYATAWNQLHVGGEKGAFTGVDLSDSADVYGGFTIVVGSRNGLVLDNSGVIFLPAVDIDSGTGTAISMDNAHSVSMDALVWCNASEGAAWTHAIDIGQDDVVDGLRLDCTVRRPGGTGVRIDQTAASRITGIVTDIKGGTADAPPMSERVVCGDSITDTRIDLVE